MKNFMLNFGVVKNSNGNYDLVNSFTNEYIPCNESYNMVDIYSQRIYNGDYELLEYLREKHKCVRLQGICRPLPAKAVKQLKVNDIIIWNFGHKSEVVSIEPTKTRKSYKIALKSQDGIVRERMLRADRLVAIG